MARTVAIGRQDFKELITNDYFYIDKTGFIKEWWKNGDSVTLITRPRRFGKTLTMNMLERFFSVKYRKDGKIFSGLHIWEQEKYRNLQGTYPVISISFADVKDNTYKGAMEQIYQILSELYTQNEFLRDSSFLSDRDRAYFDRVNENMSQTDAVVSIRKLCDFMQRYYRKKVIVLLDEYDTPMQEAYIHGYWDNIAAFMKKLFNSTFKTNPFLDRAIMTGITRISKFSYENSESIFSDLNNIAVITTTSNKYADSFGFTQQEVSDALHEFGLSDKEAEVRDWYDGFTFGNRTDIYNPWSITNFLDTGELKAYWANTSSNSLVSKLIRRGSKAVKFIMEDLLNGTALHTKIDEQIIFSQLDYSENAIWSLLLASGYLKVEKHTMPPETEDEEYDLKLTNNEIKRMFCKMIQGWFETADTAYNDFIKALLTDDKKAMNHYMNQVALATFSYFDAGNKPSNTMEPERFYHGFVLGLIVDLADRYVITSNRESGFGRYDVMLKPKNDPDGKNAGDNAILMEFKVRSPEDEKTLQDTADAALRQIEEKQYAASLKAEGIPAGHIKQYGFAFEGKTVFIA